MRRAYEIFFPVSEKEQKEFPIIHAFACLFFPLFLKLPVGNPGRAILVNVSIMGSLREKS